MECLLIFRSPRVLDQPLQRSLWRHFGFLVCLFILDGLVGFLLLFQCQLSERQRRSWSRSEGKRNPTSLSGVADWRQLHFSKVRQLQSIKRIFKLVIFWLITYRRLRSIHDKATSKVGDSCYRRGLCEIRSYLATTRFYSGIPKLMYVRCLIRLLIFKMNESN